MQTFISVRGANLQRPHTTKGAVAGAVSAAGARTGSFSGWFALAVVGVIFGALVFWGIVAEEVCK